MVGAPAARDALARARGLPALKVGLHLTLVRGRPLLPPGEIPRLVDGAGEFRDDPIRAGFRIFLFPAVRRQAEAELRAQFEAFRETGLRLDHVNSHNHMHLHPTLLGMILRIGREYGLRAVRLPYEPFLPSWRASREGLARRLLSWAFLAPWAFLARSRLRGKGVRCNDSLFGMNDTGRMGKERVLGLLSHLPRGVSEIYFHPSTADWPDPAAEGYEPTRELEALVSPEVAEALRAAGVRISGFEDLGGGAVP